MAPSNWDTRFEHATDLVRENRWKTALHLFQRLLKDASTPDEIFSANFMLAGVHAYGLSDWACAEPLYRACVTRRPRHERASLGLFHSLLEQGETDAAFDEMRRLLALRPSPAYAELLADLNA